MDHMNDVWFEQTCTRLQQAKIAKVSFQIYWYSDEETIDEVKYFDINEHEIQWSQSLSDEDLWNLIPQGKEQLGRFELYPLEKRLLRLGVARPAELEDIYNDLDIFDGGRDDEAIEDVYSRLQKSTIHALTLKSYCYRGLHEIVDVSCFDEKEKEIALPKELSESDLRIIVEDAPERFGLLKLLVDERRWLFLSALNGKELGFDDAEGFEGGEGEGMCL